MKNLKKSYWIIICAIMSVNYSYPAPDIKRRITLSLGYSQYFNSNEGMKHLPLTTIQGYSWVFDQATKMTSNLWGRGFLVAADVVLHMPYLGQEFNMGKSNWFLKEKWWPYLPAYHEFGHGRAIIAFSNQFTGYTINVVGNPTDYKSNTVIDYYLYSLKFAALNYSAVTNFNGPLSLRKFTHELPIYAGGLNNEFRLSKEIAEWTYKFNGHIAYFGPYLRGKIAPISYTEKSLANAINMDNSDIKYILEYYRLYDPTFKAESIKYAGWISLLLSSSTYAFLKGYWDFILTGDPTVKTFTYKGFRLPDVNLYFTRNGLSLEALTAYQWNPNLWINLGIETVYYPKLRGAEINTGVRYVMPNKGYGTFEFEINTIYNTYNYLGGQIGLSWTDPDNPFTLESKVILHNANTYFGERNINYARNNDYNLEFMVNGSLNY